MTSIKDKLLALKSNIHSIEVGEHTLYFKHLKASHNAALTKLGGEDYNVVAFILSLCEEDGSPVFTLDDIEEVKELPRLLVNVVSNAALFGDEKKPYGF